MFKPDPSVQTPLGVYPTKAYNCDEKRNAKSKIGHTEKIRIGPILFSVDRFYLKRERFGIIRAYFRISSECCTLAITYFGCMLSNIGSDDRLSFVGKENNINTVFANVSEPRALVIINE